MAGSSVNESTVSSVNSKREETCIRDREILSLQVEICDHDNNYVQSSLLLCEDLDQTA